MCLEEFGGKREDKLNNAKVIKVKQSSVTSSKNVSTMTDQMDGAPLDADLQAQQDQLYELATYLEEEKTRVEEARESLRVGQEIVVEAKSVLEDATAKLAEEKADFELEKKRFEEEKAAFEKQKAELESERSSVASLRSRCEGDQTELSLQKQRLLDRIAAAEKREKEAAKVINDDRSAWLEAKSEVTSIEQGLSTALEDLKKLQDRCNKHANENRSDDAPAPTASLSRRRSLKSDDVTTASPAEKNQRRSV
ncbi:hypothetical protein AAVH_17833 [Aphelenchoides avenae]|nr:hypothetical protein AAVH_17833 [Aphelenchus avenae]